MLKWVKWKRTEKWNEKIFNRFFYQFAYFDNKKNGNAVLWANILCGEEREWVYTSIFHFCFFTILLLYKCYRKNVISFTNRAIDLGIIELNIVQIYSAKKHFRRQTNRYQDFKIIFSFHVNYYIANRFSKILLEIIAYFLFENQILRKKYDFIHLYTTKIDFGFGTILNVSRK